MIEQFDTESLARDHEHRLPSSNRRAQDIDRYVAARMRERRIMLGLTQQQLAELIGIRERALNGVSPGHLYTTAAALGVDIGYFFNRVDTEGTFQPTRHRLLLEFMHNFVAIPNRRHQQEVVALARNPGKAR